MIRYFPVSIDRGCPNLIKNKELCNRGYEISVCNEVTDLGRPEVWSKLFFIGYIYCSLVRILTSDAINFIVNSVVIQYCVYYEI